MEPPIHELKRRSWFDAGASSLNLVPCATRRHVRVSSPVKGGRGRSRARTCGLARASSLWRRLFQLCVSEAPPEMTTLLHRLAWMSTSHAATLRATSCVTDSAVLGSNGGGSAAYAPGPGRAPREG